MDTAAGGHVKPPGRRNYLADETNTIETSRQPEPRVLDYHRIDDDDDDEIGRRRAQAGHSRRLVDSDDEVGDENVPPSAIPPARRSSSSVNTNSNAVCTFLSIHPCIY